MPDNVIEGPWTAAQRDGYDGMVCACGEAWFRLWMPPEDELGPVVVAQENGAVTGYRGFLKCIVCGKVQ